MADDTAAKSRFTMMGVCGNTVDELDLANWLHCSRTSGAVARTLKM